MFQKMILEYVSGMQNTSHVFADLVENQGVIIRTEDNKGVMLSNGMMVR